jgi:hypothetical protein
MDFRQTAIALLVAWSVVCLAAGAAVGWAARRG